MTDKLTHIPGSIHLPDTSHHCLLTLETITSSGDTKESFSGLSSIIL